MNIFAEFQARIASAARKADRGRRNCRAGSISTASSSSRRATPTHGDLSTNAAMVYAREAKAAGSNPRALAEALAADLEREPPTCRAAEVAGPGFINIVLRARGLRRMC